MPATTVNVAAKEWFRGQRGHPKGRPKPEKCGTQTRSGRCLAV